MLILVSSTIELPRIGIICMTHYFNIFAWNLQLTVGNGLMLGFLCVAESKIEEQFISPLHIPTLSV